MIDPISMATQLATYDVYPFEYRAIMQLEMLNAKRSALSSVNSELSSFGSFVSSLNSYNNSVIKNSATSSNDDFLTGSASANAQAGTYQIFVEQLAQSHQLATQLPSGTTADSLIPAQGELTFELNGEEFVIDLAEIANDDGEVSYMDLMTAINADPNNIGINASLVRTNGEVQMLFTSEESGDANEIIISSNTNDSEFNDFMNSANMKELVKNQDSVAWLGGENSGIRLQNESNQLNNVIDGVDMTLTKAQSTGDTPITLTVGADTEATHGVMNEFADRYNAIISEINKHTGTGNDSESRGVLASDATTRGIKNGMRSIMQQPYNGVSLSEIGFEFDRNGTLKFDSDKFDKFQATSTVNIDDMFRGDGMLLDQMKNTLDIYGHPTTGSLKNQIDTIDIQKTREDDKLEALDRKYEMSYNRYLKQFTALSTLQIQMANNANLFY